MRRNNLLRLIFISSLILLFAFSSYSQIVNPKPLSKRLTGYSIDARLDPDSKIVSGTMEAYWVNNSDSDVPDIQMHMYLNAFRSNKTTFFRESLDIPSKSKKEDFGWINITSIKDIFGNDLADRMKYISPDDGNPEDMTVLQIMLPEPVKSGDTVTIFADFESRLPFLSYRTGFNDDFFFVAQWFPKFGVYETEGMRFASKAGWNCHQFHFFSEFYSNHSVYDINISVPVNYIMASGGLQLKEILSEDGRYKTVTYRAEDIVDFAWTAWPGYAVYKDKWKHVSITFLSPPERKNQVGRQLQAVKNALEYLEEKVGPYPWPHLTFVDPPAKGGGSGGMEYTTLFTTESSYGMPVFMHIPEMVTVHEFGHAYFMGILASNEFEEPWLDEGVNTFWEARIMDHYYGKNTGMIDHPLLKLSDNAMSRLPYITSGSRQVISNNEYSWNYPHGTYGMMSYNKAATWLFTLMGLTGEETMDEIFREYYRKWAFKHPSGRDFVNVVNEVVTRRHGSEFGPDLNWFFDQTLYGTGVVDYKVRRFVNSKVTAFKGISAEGDSLIPGQKRDSIYNSSVELERAGEVMLPVEVMVHFDNGESILEKWDGKARYKDFVYTGSRKVDWVKIDPDHKIKMDINYANNSFAQNPDRIPMKSFTNKIMAFMQFFISFISL